MVSVLRGSERENRLYIEINLYLSLSLRIHRELSILINLYICVPEIMAV